MIPFESGAISDPPNREELSVQGAEVRGDVEHALFLDICTPQSESRRDGEH